MKEKIKFEHRSEKVLSLPHFLLRMGGYVVFSFALVLFSIIIGVAGYCSFSGLSILDSFHMSCMILTGMGPVVEMKTESAKIFSSIYALYSGVAFLSITAVFFAPLVHRVLHILHVEEKSEY